MICYVRSSKPGSWKKRSPEVDVSYLNGFRGFGTALCLEKAKKRSFYIVFLLVQTPPLGGSSQDL